MRGNVWVFAEEPLEESLKLVAEARTLADSMKVEVDVLAFDLKEEPEVFGRYGANKVFTCRLEEGENIFRNPIYAETVSRLAKTRKPALILFPSTPNGEDVAARVAAKLGSGFISNCLEIFFENGVLKARKPVYEDKAHAVMAWTGCETAIATMRTSLLELKESRTGRPKMVRVEPAKVDVGVRFAGRIKADPKLVDVSEADVVIGVGRGVSPESMKLVEDLAEALKASIGGTRAALDKGLIPYERQIGISGKKIAPKLYVACGISGSPYHTLGIKNARFTIAINLDKSAPIVKTADLTLIGDVQTCIPAILKKLGGRRYG